MTWPAREPVGPAGGRADGIERRPTGNGARMLRSSRVAVLLVAAAILGLCAGVLWGSAERLADRRAPGDQAPALVTER
jgi:hypothetical protein